MFVCLSWIGHRLRPMSPSKNLGLLTADGGSFVYQGHKQVTLIVGNGKLVRVVGVQRPILSVGGLGTTMLSSALWNLSADHPRRDKS